METQQQELENDREWEKLEKANRRGKIVGGLLIVAIGTLFLMKELGVQLPQWLFTWKMLLIGIGIVTAIKHKFMHPGWVVLVGIGGLFLLNDFCPEMNIRPFIWPVIIILVGLFVMFKPRNKRYHRDMRHYYKAWGEAHKEHHQWHHHPRQRFNNFCEQTINDDYIDSTTVMAGTKRSVLSKKFKGGEVTNVLGGTEINLMQADMEEQVTLEVTQVLGGTSLIVPAHWEIKSEIVAILGNVEDKRPNRANVNTEPAKILRLVGTVVLGGIEIKSF